MKLIWVYLIIINIINVTRAKNFLDIFLENRFITSDVSKPSKPLLYIVTKRRSIGLFPRIGNKGEKFMVTVKPPIENYKPTTKPEKYETLMPKLSIKFVNNKNSDTVNAEVTTRRALMQIKKFTVKPHDVYSESVREKYNWNSYRKKNVYNSRTPKSDQNIVETNFNAIKKEATIPYDLQKNMSLKNNYNESEKLDNHNSKVVVGSKLKLLFPKRNNTKYFKGISEQKVSKVFQNNNFVSDIKVSSNEVNHINNGFIKEKEMITVSSNEFIKSNSYDKIETIEPRVNDQELKDQDEFISVKDVNIMSFVEPNGDDEITTEGDVEDLRPESVNIKEENVATTFSGIEITKHTSRFDLHKCSHINI